MRTQNKVPLYNKKPIDFSLTPYILTKKQAKHIESALTGLLIEVEKFTDHVLTKKSALLKYLGLPRNLDASCSALGLNIPFARFDFIFDHHTQNISVFELNTDGTSGWNVVEWLGNKAKIPQGENPNFLLSQRLLRGIKAHQPGAKKIILTDFNDVMTHDEQKNLCQLLKIELKSPEDKNWKDYKGALVYRRAVSWDLRKRGKECLGFLKQWSEKKITVVGGWSSDVGMSKAWPAFIKSPLVAETVLLNKKNKKHLIEDKNNWIIKPLFSHSGRNLKRGIDCTEKEWKKAVLKSKKQVFQKLVPLPKENNTRVELGLYFINGKPSGYMCRSGHYGAITDTSTDVLRPVQISG